MCIIHRQTHLGTALQAFSSGIDHKQNVGQRF